MSNYVCGLPTESYFDFKIEYYKRFPKSNYRLGQALINRYIKKEDNSVDYQRLWASEDTKEVEELFFQLIRNNNWCMVSLQPVRNIY